MEIETEQISGVLIASRNSNPVVLSSLFDILSVLGCLNLTLTWSFEPETNTPKDSSRLVNFRKTVATAKSKDPFPGLVFARLLGSEG